GVRRPVAGRGDVRELPAPQARPARPAADPHAARRRVQPAAAARRRARGQMRIPRQRPPGRGRLSLRSRLLAGLMTITALVLIVMGVVTTIVLGTTEQDQFNTELSLTVKESLPEIANLSGGYAAAYLNLASRTTGVLSGPSDTASDLQSMLNSLVASGKATA